MKYASFSYLPSLLSLLFFFQTEKKIHRIVDTSSMSERDLDFLRTCLQFKSGHFLVVTLCIWHFNSIVTTGRQVSRSLYYCLFSSNFISALIHLLVLLNKQLREATRVSNWKQQDLLEMWSLETQNATRNSIRNLSNTLISAVGQDISYGLTQT